MYSDNEYLLSPSDSRYDSDLAASSDSGDDCSNPEFDSDGEVVDDDDEYDPPPFHMTLMQMLCSQMWISVSLWLPIMLF